jgi:membrane protein DedA with SNARE-associated domain
MSPGFPGHGEGASVPSAGEIYVYLGIFAALLAAGVGFPIPEEIPIVTAGVLAGRAPEKELVELGRAVALLGWSPAAGFPAGLPWGGLLPPDDTIPVRWWIMLPVCILGVVISDGFLYGLGRFFGTRLFRVPFMTRLMPPDKLAGIESNFHRYGVKILLFARLLPGIRAPIFITAGIMRLPLKRFLLADGIYAIPGVSLLFGLAFWFTNSFRDLVMRAEEKVIQWRPILILAAVVAVTVYFIIHVYRKPVSTGDPKEIPLIGNQVASHIDHDPQAPAQPKPKGAKADEGR